MGPPRLPPAALGQAAVPRPEPEPGPAERARSNPIERRRITTLSLRAPLHGPDGALRRGLERGMLCANHDEQAGLVAVCARLWDGTGARGVAVRAILRAFERGSVGAAGLLAALGDPKAVRHLAAIVVDRSEHQPRRLAGLRATLVIWQAAREQDDHAPVPLMAAVRRAARSDAEQVRYTAAFVLAMMGRREVRPLLERGVAELHSTALLSYCVLGLREIGNGASVQALRDLLPRTTGTLASLTHEAVQAIELRLRPPLPAHPTIPAPRGEFHNRPTVRLDPGLLRA